MMTPAYERSLIKALNAHGGLLDYATLYACLPEKVASICALDVVALVSTRVEAWPNRQGTIAFAHTLAMRGYDAKTSLAIYDKFTKAFPEFQPELAMLMSREAIADTFGSMYGKLLVDMMLDRTCQPILHALLFSGKGERILTTERECCGALFTMHLPGVQFPTQGRPSNLGGSELWKLREEMEVDPKEADAHFYHVTDGMRLERVVPIFRQHPFCESTPYAPNQETQG